MKQVLQNLGNGVTTVVDFPCPAAGPGSLLIRSSASLISAGTERMLVDFGRGSLVDKVRLQPDKVKQVLEKARTDGVVSTLEAVRTKLDQPIALGYCNVGRVLAIGAGVDGFAVGERVVSNGKHAEVVVVPRNLCARVPDGVDDETAAFTVLAAIALQGVRLAQPTLGEAVAVVGLGPIGLLTVQILRANGCRVLGVDPDPSRLALAREFGAETFNNGKGEGPLAVAASFSRGRGVDAVLLTASTASSEPVAEAARICRKRGRIVLVGVTGLELSRADFYEKELSFQVSCSYGPGRYDKTYEEGGQDYPIGYVRWTEQRNFEAVLDLMAAGTLDPVPLITHRFPLAEAAKAYDLLASNESSLGILLEYPGPPEQDVRVLAPRTIKLTSEPAVRIPAVAFIGAGNYAGRVLMPAFKVAGAGLHTVVSTGGVGGVHYGTKHGFVNVSTDADAVFAEPGIDTVVIATRHDSHAHYVTAALAAGKHLFVEKPLCLTFAELSAIETALAARPDLKLMVGFNRRFAPHIVKIRHLLSGVVEPKAFVMTVNAGAIPRDHWTQDLAVGGGRIVGEACHFIDLLRHLAGAPIVEHSAVAFGRRPATSAAGDNATLTLRFADGSIGTIHYLANGDRSFPKERLEVFVAGRVLQLDNFRKLRGFGWPHFTRMSLWRQDKGQVACVAAYVESLRSDGPAPIGRSEILEVSRVAIEAQQAIC